MSKNDKQDKLFEKDSILSQFKFDEKVAQVFDDMVSRSVPQYKETIKAVINLANSLPLITLQYMMLVVQPEHYYQNVKIF